MPQIETHVFGSKDGYETLSHSAGLSSIELAELDGLGFGQSSDPRVLAHLSTNPTALGRFLTSGRFAITRCVQGPPDDAGRSTFRLLTIVLDAHDYLSDVRHRLSSLLEDRTLWDVDRFSNQKSLRGRSGNPTPRDARSSAIAGQWAAATGATRTACFVEEPDGDQLVLRVVSELPEIAAQQLSWGVRLFSAGTQATLFTTVPGVPLSASRKIVRVSATGGAAEWDPQQFAEGTSGETRAIPRSPKRLARSPLVLSAVATLVILVVGFWPSGSQQPSRQGLTRSPSGTKDRAFEPSQRTLSVPSPEPALAPEPKPNPESEQPAAAPESELEPSLEPESSPEQKPEQPAPAPEPKLEPGSEPEPNPELGSEQPEAGPKPNPESEQPAPAPEPKLEPGSEPEPNPEVGPEQPQSAPILEPVVNPSEINCELWLETRNKFRVKLNTLKYWLKEVGESEIGDISVKSDSRRQDWSNDFPKDLLQLEDYLLDIQKFSQVSEERRGHPPVLSGDPTLYRIADKMRVMAILEYWTSERQEVTQLGVAFGQVYKKANKFMAKFESRDSGSDPNQELIGAYEFAERLVSTGRSVRDLAKLLDDNSGAERDLFEWVTVNRNSPYGDLVVKSQESFAEDKPKANAIMAPIPGLLLDELPCQGGVDESSD